MPGTPQTLHAADMSLRGRVSAGLLTLLAGAAYAGPVLDRIKQSGRIVIAHRDASVPFSYLDEYGRPVGYAIDLCLRFTEVIRKKLAMPELTVVYLPVTSATRINVIADGKADLECESTTNTAERRQKVAFTVPHFITGTRFLVRADSQISELRDFEQKTLVSTVGTTDLKAITQVNKERLLRMNVGEVPDHAKGIEMVEKAKADGFALNDVLLYGLMAARPDPSALKVVGKYLTIDPLGIMLSRTDTEFKQLVNDEMKRLIRSREAYAIYDRWFMQPIPPKYRSLNLPMNYLTRDFWKYPSTELPN